MQKTISISYGFNLNKTIDKIIKQQVDIPANIAFALYKLHRQLTEMEEFVFQRLSMVCGDNIDFNNMTENQKILYSSVLYPQDGELLSDIIKKLNSFSKGDINEEDINS